MELPSNTIEWITPAGNIGTVTELSPFIFTIQANSSLGFPVTLTIVDGILPESLSFSTGGVISGIVTELDNYIEAFTGELVIERDGSNYASTGSAAVGFYECEFTVRATSNDGVADTIDERIFSIRVDNNWSSDRNRLIRQHSLEYGENNELFFWAGQRVDGEVYLINNGWSLGDSPLLSELSWILYIQRTDQNQLNFAGQISFTDEVTF